MGTLTIVQYIGEICVLILTKKKGFRGPNWPIFLKISDSEINVEGTWSTWSGQLTRKSDSSEEVQHQTSEVQTMAEKLLEELDLLEKQEQILFAVQNPI